MLLVDFLLLAHDWSSFLGCLLGLIAYALENAASVIGGAAQTTI